jgi:chorismate synthase
MVLRFLTAGESHGPALIAIIEGLPSNLRITRKMIDNELVRRQTGFGAGPRMKIEHDHVKILSGILEGRTTGAPIAIMIENKDHIKWLDHSIPSFTIPRPGHADLAGLIKYNFNDIRPVLERASARETAARVAIGAICKQFLKEFQIIIGGYTSSIGTINGNYQEIPFEERIRIAEMNDVRCPDISSTVLMEEQIRNIIKNKDTLGGIIEVIAIGVPPGLGSYVQWDRRLDTRLGAALLSIQAIKGVEFDHAFNNTQLPGTKAQDDIRFNKDRRTIYRQGHRSGGLEGGITTGEPIIIRAALKPIATTLNSQNSVDLKTGKEVKTNYERSDFCPVPRAVPILESMVSFIISDALLEKLGGDSMDEIKPRFDKLAGSSISDFHLDGQDHLFWSSQDEE